ncbi:non-homologous end-joining DNA ligase [Amycolatopsis anabasis]|uniref:non-homologous end-joining DNA ligase n=1 Tax=Amycolatopsis anabasis TaxID=1840409 RepID=UPI001FE28448|nr:non-homologous end-joining DNA ligase [Amycolatopsis anabasis]
MNPDEIKTSRPDKLFYPDDGVTKGDVVEHYRRVADVMVPHLRGRPLTLRRYPDGITGENWFQKEASDYFPDWIRVEKVPARSDGSGSVHYVVCDDAATLVYLANQATIEFHIWTSTVDALDRPDLMVIDIDPPDGTEVAQLREVARSTRLLYEHIGLTAYVQATGGRGFHVVAPLDATADYETVRGLAADAARVLARHAPDQLTTQVRKDKRGNRIFLDVNRNGFAQTFVSPYSLRSRPGAPLATPLDWKELGRAEPNGWDPDRARQRLARKADPWRTMQKNAASAARARERLAELT